MPLSADEQRKRRQAKRETEQAQRDLEQAKRVSDPRPYEKALEGKVATRAERLAWVEQNRLRSAATIRHDEPPDMAALDLWQLAQDDEWWKAVFRANAVADAKAGNAEVPDDGRVLTMLDSLSKELKDAK